MTFRTDSKGKKRALEQSLDDENNSETSSEVLVPSMKYTAKKPKRAETRVCPICAEAIPLRLLAKHCQFESDRVEEIIQNIGSTEVMADAEPDDGLSSRVRRSAMKARKSMARSKSNFASTSEVTLELATKTINALKRHRKQRHAQLRELTHEDEDGNWWGKRTGEEEVEVTPCPVCGTDVRGDVDVVEAHVDACLAHLKLQEAEEAVANRDGDHTMLDFDVDIDGEGAPESMMNGVNFRGTGFDTRNRHLEDVDDEVDVEGEDEAVFGAAQFTEDDILALNSNAQPSPLEVLLPDDNSSTDDDVKNEEGASGDHITSQDGKTLRDLVMEGKVVKKAVIQAKQSMEEVMGVGEADEVERAVKVARHKGDLPALIAALDAKVNFLESSRVSSSTSLLCRICLDPYTEPTVSTGCWHTCCRECWLRCLGSTKLCPICKRITGAADLRRVYL